ncbi:ATP-dependent protease La domain protein [Vibrio cholerae]|nr:ATP-dependent protease La domain protein [Vibrio cholerae]
MNLERSERIEIPVLPLRDVVVYPHMVIPLFVGREKSIQCLEAAMDNNKQVLLVAQKKRKPMSRKSPTYLKSVPSQPSYSC